MKKTSLFAFAFLWFFAAETLFAACIGTSCLPKSAQQACTVKKSNGCIDWENGVIYAVGMGVPNPKFKSAAQKRYSAYQAARIVAMRNLLQMVEGINIDSTQTVKMGMLENDEINTQINGKIKQVEEVGQPVSAGDGSAWVTMRMYMRDIMSALEGTNQFFKSGGQFQPQASAPSPSAVPSPTKAALEEKKGSIYGGSADQIYNGLIIDARGTGVTPAMSPKVFDKNGKEVYGSSAVDRDFAIQFGIAGYVKDLEKAKASERVKGNCLILKALQSSGNKSSDLRISQEDGALLSTLDTTQAFLREGRVIILMD